MVPIDRTARIRDLFEAMVPEFGKPLRTRPAAREPQFTRSAIVVPLADYARNDEVHPVFALAHHFRSNDDYVKGYTDNPYRGDHISIPAYLGFGNEVAVLETSFHKGETYIEVVTFPEAERDTALYRAALDVLSAEETR